jgi:hypothetical protein
MYDTDRGEVTSATPTAALLLPRGTDMQRPSSATNGLIRYNTTTESFEGYSADVWAAIGSGGGGWESSIVNQADTYTEGNVGIGTTAPTYGLHVYKNVALGSGLVTNIGAGGPYFKQGVWTQKAASHVIPFVDYSCGEDYSSGTIHLQLNSFDISYLVGSVTISFIKYGSVQTDISIQSEHFSPGLTTFTASVDASNNINITTNANTQICWTVIGAC